MASRFVTVLALPIAVVIAEISFAGCSGIRSAPLLPPGPNAVSPETSPTSGVLVVRLVVHSSDRSPKFLSPSSKGLTVEIKGPTKLKKTVGLIVGAAGCKSKLMSLQCGLRVGNLKTCPSKKPCYTATIRTYDAYANKKIPPGAHLLSAIEGFKFHIGSGATFLPLVLDGVPASVAFVPSANSALTGSQKSGFVFPKCNSAAQTVTLIGVDADGNYIVGPGAPALTLVSGNSSQLSVVASPGEVNAFTLNPPVAPSYAYGGHAVSLTATAKPTGKGLGAGAVTHVDVAYSGDICGVMTEFAVPTSPSAPFGITAGPDGAMWFTDYDASAIGRVSLDGKITKYDTPSASRPAGIVTGPDHALWFTEFLSGNIGRITTNGSITETPIPTTNSGPIGITVGPDKALWFTEEQGNKVGRITTTQAITEFSISTPDVSPREITAGPNNALWFTEYDGNQIASVTIGGSITQVPLPTPTSLPDTIALGPGNLIWFTEHNTNAVAVANASGFVVATFSLPASSGPSGEARGPDGAIWFGEQESNRIGRIAPSGNLTEFLIPTTGAFPEALTVGSDGAVWFTETLGKKIGRLR